MLSGPDCRMAALDSRLAAARWPCDWLVWWISVGFVCFVRIFVLSFVFGTVNDARLWEVGFVVRFLRFLAAAPTPCQ